MKATISNNSGLRLHLPKTGFASMLFLEWFRDRDFTWPKLKLIRKDSETHFKIEMPGAIREDYESARDYINANL